MNHNCAQKTLSMCCYFLGRLIARHPSYFIIIPTLFSLVLATGYLKISYERNPEYLYSMTNSKAMKNREAIENIFSLKEQKDFDISRVTRVRDGIFVILMPKDRGSVLRKNILMEISEIDEIIQNITVEMGEEKWNYSRICARSNEKCFANLAAKIITKVEEAEEGKLKIKYPLDIDFRTFKITAYAINLGGVKVDENDYIQDSTAFRLQYFYKAKTKLQEKIAARWEIKVRNFLDYADFNVVDSYRISYRSVEDEFSKNTADSVPLIGIAAILMLLFSMVTCMTTEWIRSKPWLGLSGFVSAGLAVIATFGMLMYCKVKYADAVIALPFLMTGMGMDDSFVLISAWRRTNAQKNVEERMGNTYGEVAVSITITSLTNLLSFCFGMVAPFPVVQIFCIYAAVAVLFTYIYQVTFFGGCMALSGYREARQLNPFTFRPVVQKEKPLNYEEKSILSQQDKFMKLFRDKLGNLLSQKISKFVVVTLFLANLGVGFWGCTHMKEGMEMTDVMHPESSSAKYMKLNFEYFGNYTGRIQVAINNTLNYADPEVKKTLEDMIQQFEASPLIKGGFFTEFWYKYYILMANSSVGRFTLGSFNLSHKQDFIDGLHNVFLKFPQTKRLRTDISFNENYTEILASRFHLTIYNCDSREKERELFQHVKDVTSRFDLSILTHSLYFIFNEQMFVIKSIFIQTVCIAAAVMLIIFFVFIPDFTCALCVAVTIVAVEIESVGYMSLWGVNLDVLSMISLVMCVGFSVNYPAHIAYAYITSGRSTPNERLRMALYAVGMPIFQGSVSTILGIIVLAFLPSYMLLVFLKTIFLIVIFTALHAMFLLPVVLTIWENCCKINICINKQHHLNEDKNSDGIIINDLSKDKQEENCLITKNMIVLPPIENNSDDVWIKRTDFL